MNTNERIASVNAKALRHLVTGQSAEAKTCSDSLGIIVGGRPLDPVELLGWFNQRSHGTKALIAIAPHPHTDDFPLISLATRCMGKNVSFLDCLPWMGPADDRAVLIPCDFEWGSFRFTDDARIKHLKRSPKSDWDTALEGIVRAHQPLHNLMAEYWEASGFDAVQGAAAA
jgi:hypothetical protein